MITAKILQAIVPVVILQRAAAVEKTVRINRLKPRVKLLKIVLMIIKSPYNLKSTLEQIDGVGKVEVMISFESGEEHVPAVNINDSTNTTQEKDNAGGTRNTTQKNNGSTVVTTSDGSKSEPLILKTYNPKVLGVCVVAEGAENKVTELRISKAVTDLFGISGDKVNVYPMKK